MMATERGSVSVVIPVFNEEANIPTLLPRLFAVLDTLDRPWAEDDRRTSRVLQTYWVNFIETGDPNGGGLPHWNAFDARQDNVMALDAAPHMRPVADAARRDAFTRWYDAAFPP